jgi:hypothetical protein
VYEYHFIEYEYEYEYEKSQRRILLASIIPEEPNVRNADLDLLNDRLNRSNSRGGYYGFKRIL